MQFEELQKQLRAFAREREWEQFHSPKNLAMALSVEASELLEIFQWLKEEESRRLSPEQTDSAAQEIADIQIYLARIADVLNVDIADSVAKKIAANHEKYPADRVRGRADKYTSYEGPQV